MKKIPIAYSKEVTLDETEWISLSKPGRLMATVEHDPEAMIIIPELLTADDIILAHDTKHVLDVCSLRSPNGFGSRRADILDQVVWANSAFYTASVAALEYGVAMAPVSGFHHAGYDYSSGFCTFNGLMVSALKLLKNKSVDDVLILDFDGHYGDGTDDIINRLGVWDSVKHLTRSRPFNDAKTAIKIALDAIRKKPGIVMLQAGADSVDNDPFGAGYFTIKEWMQRDIEIFKLCRELDIPVVWNLAGGYNGDRTIKYHYGTWRNACDIFSMPRQSESDHRCSTPAP